MTPHRREGEGHGSQNQPAIGNQRWDHPNWMIGAGGVAFVIPSRFHYSSYMEEVTRHQGKRIRTANSDELARIVDQQLYWSPAALRLILQRIERLNQEDPQEAKAASESALELLPRIRNLSTDLKALTLATHGACLRGCGHLEEALEVYRRALELEGLTEAGRGEVLARMAVTLAALDRPEESLIALNEALPLMEDPVPALAVRAYILVDRGRLDEALTDSLAVFEAVQGTVRSDYSLLSAVTTSCLILSLQNGVDADTDILQRLEVALDDYQRGLPRGGSGFYKHYRPNMMIYRARALVFLQTDRVQEAVVLLRKVVRGLTKDYPRDALAASLDLAYAYTLDERFSSAALVVKQTPDLMRRSGLDFGPIARHALQAAAKKSSLSYGEAVELRSMLRPLDGRR